MKKILFIINIVLIVLFTNYTRLNAEPRNVLVEYITGTWCGNCPCGHQTLNTITSAHPNTVILAYHAFGNDPWRVFNGNEIINLMGFSATPTTAIDRNVFIGTLNYPLWISSINDRYTTSPNSSVNLSIVSKSFNVSTSELTLNINATALENLNGQYKINVVIAENNLIYQQNVYSQCGTPGIVPNYVHNHVTRNIVNGATGENLNSGSVWNINQSISKNIQTTLNASWIPENCKIIIFVYKQETALAQSKIQQAIQESITGTTGIISSNSGISEDFKLSQNYPNPFNPTTNIKFTIPSDGDVSFKVYDLNGKEIESYINGFLQKGSYNVEFDGNNLSSGIYYYVLKSDNFTDRKKMILLK